MLRPKEPTRAYGDHTTMEARTTWVWRDSLDGELTLRSASGQAATILAYVGSSPRPFIAIAERAATAWFCGDTTEAGPFFFSETPFPGYHSSSCVQRNSSYPGSALGQGSRPGARRNLPGARPASRARIRYVYRHKSSSAFSSSFFTASGKGCPPPTFVTFCAMNVYMP